MAFVIEKEHRKPCGNRQGTIAYSARTAWVRMAWLTWAHPWLKGHASRHGVEGDAFLFSFGGIRHGSEG